MSFYMSEVSLKRIGSLWSVAVSLVGEDIFLQTKETKECTSYTFVCVAPVFRERVCCFLIEKVSVFLGKVFESFNKHMAIGCWKRSYKRKKHLYVASTRR